MGPGILDCFLCVSVHRFEWEELFSSFMYHLLDTYTKQAATVLSPSEFTIETGNKTYIISNYLPASATRN